MGAQISSSSRARGSRRKKTNPITQINVTPFVDVMLVLLVVFMITAPLLTVGVPVDLPKTQASSLQGSEEVLSVSIQKDGKIFVGESEVALDKLGAKLKAISNQNTQAKVYVRGDQGITYGNILKVMGVISSAGFSKVALISESLNK